MAGVDSFAFEDTSPLWIEVAFLFFFACGFFFLKGTSGYTRKSAQKKAKLKLQEEPSGADEGRLRQTIEAEFAKGDKHGVVAVWRKHMEHCATPVYLIRTVVLALMEVAPEGLIGEIVNHMRAHPSMCNCRTAAIFLEVLARGGLLEVMQSLWQEMQVKLDIQKGLPVYEVLLGAFASVGNAQQVKEISDEMKSRCHPFTARAHCLCIKGFLKNGLLEECLEQIAAMQQSFEVPHFAATQLFRLAAEKSRLDELFQAAVDQKLKIPSEAATVILDEILRTPSLYHLAAPVERCLRTSAPGGLPAAAHEALIKIHAVQPRGIEHAIELFQEFQRQHQLYEALCVRLLEHCGAVGSGQSRLAEAVFDQWLRERQPTAQIGASLMKVHMSGGHFNKACDLFESLVDRGLRPDDTMCDLLKKAGEQCGRDLEKAGKIVPRCDLHRFMSLVRAAGREQNVGKVMRLLEQWKDSTPRLDIAAWNCCLDVVVSSHDMATSRKLFDELRRNVAADIITYNTLLKGCSNERDTAGAQALFQQMQAEGHSPNDVTYNCMLNLTVNTSNFKQASAIVEDMQKNGISADRYTLSILMKAMKKVDKISDVTKALALLDSTAVDIYADEVLLNSVIDTCVRHGAHDRLEVIVQGFQPTSSRAPSRQVLAALIKAAGTLKRPEKCWTFWHFVEAKHVESNDFVLGCMLNALVCNDLVDEAVQLFHEMKDKIAQNTIIYSTLIKGYTTAHRPEEAMRFWRQIRSEGHRLNLVVYNSLIDANARLGLMADVSTLLEAMKEENLEPDLITIATVIKGCCVAGKLDMAMAVFESSQHQLKGSVPVFNTLLDGCSRHSRFELVDALMEKMDKLHIIPSCFTLSVLIKMYGRRRRLDSALEVASEMPAKYNFKCNIEAWTCLMCVCMNNDAMDKAEEVFEQIRREIPHGPDDKAYISLIFGFIRHGSLEKAAFYGEEAAARSNGPDYQLRRPSRSKESQHVQPSLLDVLSQLMTALSDQGLMESIGNSMLQRLESSAPSLAAALHWRIHAHRGQEQTKGETMSHEPRRRPKTVRSS